MPKEVYYKEVKELTPFKFLVLLCKFLIFLLSLVSKLILYYLLRYIFSN